VEVLPPADRATWSAGPDLNAARERFAAGDYRGCVEPLEALFFARRNTLHQGLIQYVVALHQLGLGMAPRRLLRGALDLWTPYPDRQEGVPLSALRDHAAGLLRLLESGESPGAEGWPPPPPWVPASGE